MRTYAHILTYISFFQFFRHGDRSVTVLASDAAGHVARARAQVDEMLKRFG